MKSRGIYDDLESGLNSRPVTNGNYLSQITGPGGIYENSGAGLYQKEPAYDPSYVKRMAWAGALSDISAMFGGREPQGLAVKLPMQARQMLDEQKQRQTAMLRQAEQDKLNRRYVESQITRNLAPNTPPPTQIEKLITAHDQALASGDNDRASILKQAIDKATTSSPGVQVTLNNGERQVPTTSNQTGIQKGILEAESALRDLSGIADYHSDEFLTNVGRIKASAGSFLDKMDLNTLSLADFNAQRTKFANATNQFFNSYRKEITGAAAGEKEMEDIKNSILNDELGPRAFKSAFEQFFEKAEANLNAKREAAREGINVSPQQQGSLSTDELVNKYGH